jgi:6-phosphofructokinase 1
MEKNIKIGVLTSGGDSPGMNACIRAVVRTGLDLGHEIYGIYYGYEGLIDGQLEPFDRKAVANIIHRGGTILKTARSERFMEAEFRTQAAKRLQNKDINHIIMIGGDGTVRGAEVFTAEHGFKIIGCPGTIDNDLFGTDYTIGFDTAVNTVIESIDRLRDTAESHDRVFVVEVMGRDSGQIALHSALAAGAEAVLIPETKHDTEKLIETLSNSRMGKSSKIVIVGEGDESGGAYKIADKIKDHFPALDVRVTVLGHTQRGGNPSFIDRQNASILGYEAVQEITKGNSGIMLGFLNGKISKTPFEKVKKHNKTGIDYMLNITQILAK